MEWFIRSGKPSDSLILEGLVAETAATTWSAGAIDEAIAARGARVRLAEDSEGRPLGFVLARRIADLLEIDLVGVRPDARRQGVARALLQGLIDEEIESDGLAEARLELAESNVSARALYLGLDFMVAGRRTRYYPDGDDALLLTRRFSPGRSRPKA